MRVLNVQLKHIHGGNPQVCLDYTRVLKAAGNEVFVLTNPADPFLEKHIDIADGVYAAEKMGERGSWDIISILYFWRTINKLCPEVILVHEGRSAALMKRAAGKKAYVIDVNHGRSPKQSKAMDATIVTNKKQLQSNIDYFGAGHKVFYVENSINLDGVSEPKFQKQWQNPPVIGTIGRLVRDKALDVFIEACAILQGRGVEFSVKMAGEGEERAGLEAQIAKHDLQGKISMSGWVTNPDEFYKNIDIFCFPSRREEFGLVLLEAYKHGLPVVVSDADGPSDIVENDVDGLMVPKENAVALADALERVIKDKKLADSMAKAGWEKLNKQYSVPKVADKLQAVLEAVAGIKNRSAA